VASLIKRRGPSQFERAADGSMTLIEHLRELRSRLFKAALALVIGFVVGYFLADVVFEIIKQPYCHQYPNLSCDEVKFIQLEPAAGFLLKLKIALWVGLIASAPVWLFQLWAFIAPGLHRHERKWAYVFVAIAAPLFLAGAVLAYFVIDKGLHFLLASGVTGVETQLEVTRYVSFVTTLLLIFGVAFEFPLVALMLNFTGMVTARRLLSWWRAVVFVFFLFSAIVTPTPDPFGMTALAAALSVLYFGAVGLAFLNDKRRGRNNPSYAGLSDDEVSPLEYDREPIEEADPVAAPAPLDASYDEPRQITRQNRYDDMT
jgi:sec-independent protein translocase protein TatC